MSQNPFENEEAESTETNYLSGVAPVFGYLTPYVGAATFQHVTPGPLYEVHYQYADNNNQSEQHYPIIPLNYGYHHYNYSSVMPGHFVPSYQLNNGGTVYYHHQYPQFASHYDDNSRQNDGDEGEMEKTTGDEEEKSTPYIVEEPEEAPEEERKESMVTEMNE